MKICGQNTNILNSNILNTTVKTQKFVNVLQIFFFPVFEQVPLDFVLVGAPF